MRALLKIEWIRIWRNWQMFILAILMPVLFFLFFSATIKTGSASGNKEFIRTYMVTMTSFSMSSFSLFSFPNMLKQDFENHYLAFIEHSSLPVWTYYMAKIFRVLVYFVISIIVVFSVGHFFRGIDLV
ncbi:hypothetical protein HMPREF9318_00628 [Streptococcus urinalis FB127-CNA-2]|uniref:ABC-2 type transporter domain protein n=1 Tax=Streptococcus urinalis 2285-97 TaxID=764291 RepID=G5KGZ0_9STRE|nr:ABC-2 type transporter domain protein [Streptococcus urinalis 2285-97]EKS22430.1 hypothetical protein HMPREF9318_00628 [Streptococcus urinalis FB127-CNA-2]VEF32243.1 ABC transporter permease [Streptococcus urinalis]